MEEPRLEIYTSDSGDDPFIYRGEDALTVFKAIDEAGARGAAWARY
jgi:hypothetical protein